MLSPIEQALITLFLTLNSLTARAHRPLDPPRPITKQSLVLKPEEEIGRTYTQHIAVERLKHRLDIDKVVARPPVAPRIYKKP